MYDSKIIQSSGNIVLNTTTVTEAEVTGVRVGGRMGVAAAAAAAVI